MNFEGKYQMKKRTLGNSGLTVAAIDLGCKGMMNQ
jgi:aryl-alcohol dehydrogenase-like predicted oxidoreductase